MSTNAAQRNLKVTITLGNHNRITLNPAVCHGKACVRGLRYPVESVLEWLAGGMAVDDIPADYADLERKDVYVVLSYAARLTHVSRTEPLAA